MAISTAGAFERVSHSAYFGIQGFTQAMHGKYIDMPLHSSHVSFGEKRNVESWTWRYCTKNECPNVTVF